MTKINLNHKVQGKQVQLNFDGGNITSDAGILLIDQVDKKINLVERAANCIHDPRNQNLIKHELSTLLRQRVYGLALGYEDLNDHDHLRVDPLFQTALGYNQALASSSTLCRFEKMSSKEASWEIHELMVDVFIESFPTPPEELILDFDATDVPVHGNQVGHFFSKYYDHHCFLPLYVFCGEKLLTAYLRPVNQDQAKHSAAILKLLTKKLREAWPKVRLLFRADSGFCRPLLLNWCDRNNVTYIIGIGGNSVLAKYSFKWRKQAEYVYLTQIRDNDEEEDKEKASKRFGEFQYAAKTWPHKRRVIVKSECSIRGSNTRYIVTNLPESPSDLYRIIYCDRGNMERYIGEQLTFFSDRTSCHNWWPNQLRILLASLAYILVETLKQNYLIDTEFEKSSCKSIQLKLLKIGAVVTWNTRRVRIFMSSAYPYQDTLTILYYLLLRPH